MSEIKDHLAENTGGGRLTPAPEAEQAASPPAAAAEPAQAPPAPPEPPLKYYEIIYGVLFDPVPTMRRLAANPPLGAAFVIVILLALAGMLASLYIYARSGAPELGGALGLPWQQHPAAARALRAAAPVLALLGAVFYFVKWFFYSALLHLLAEFYGGRGRARTVFVIYGLAGLPEVFLIPLNVLTALAAPAQAALLNTLGNLVTLVWGTVLLTIGLREAHRISTGRALAVIVTPVLAVLALALVTLVALAGTLSALLPATW
ncbi:Yip1 family protein [Desulforamulus hydrothermalis]|uniref:Yip1 domain-containing protein n=1 Tax=Desulforamulus hydrothermalis Lam5 = DSM 18033 TaxID=1121428 RepID=K8EII1_9FIRM|nr:Yip1 family protein [Desulforamulus hydrothermalis]CCO08406.1 conserved membrane hypothetical protein [Desulforamulus hydrothermalis Lam5 = DSM 18033]SHH14746.1 hypothetical protein SAMN02745177_01621 [Desulforamulus hydrothermalis Lam5 = DSM 18033]